MKTKYEKADSVALKEILFLLDASPIDKVKLNNKIVSLWEGAAVKYSEQYSSVLALLDGAALQLDNPSIEYIKGMKFCLTLLGDSVCRNEDVDLCASILIDAGYSPMAVGSVLLKDIKHEK